MPLTPELAAHLVRLPLACITRELPHKLDHVVTGDAVPSPRALHPAFFGCFDWHSAVHAHWTLVRLLRSGCSTETAAIHAALDTTLTPANLAVETAYVREPSRVTFERPYGWAWLLQLATELHGWPPGARWAHALAPLVDAIAERYLAFFPKQTYPVRTGVHANTAFGLALALDHARAVGNAALETLIVERTLTYYAGDVDYPAHWEPSGEDFLSPALVEADLVRRVLSPDAFARWLAAFLPRGLPDSLATPAIVGDRSDPKLAHLDGLNLSRAWCLRAIANVLPSPAYAEAADRHTAAGLANVATGDYAGEHWLASFAVYLLGT